MADLNSSPDAAGATMADPVPLVTDLDGTLFRGDMLYESAADALRYRPGKALLAVLGARSRPALKAALAADHQIDIARLPWREDLLADLRAQRAAGRHIVLATAADGGLAAQVASHLDLFDEVLATEATHNLKGANKAATLVARYGERGFDYVGDSEADLAVWAHARRAVIVGPKAAALRARLNAPGAEVTVWPDTATGPAWRPAVKLLRPHQWVKNVLVFLPLLAGHQLGNLGALLLALVAFFCMSFAASATYVLNDMLDLGADRAHSRKRARPLASGRVSLVGGVGLGLGCLAVAAALALLLPVGAAVLVAVYMAFTTLYSTVLKRKLLIDVFTLALLYTLRVLVGSEATGVLSSPWMLGFTGFLFLSLAFAKRAAEMMSLEKEGRVGAAGRDYYVWDRGTLTSAGVGSAFCASLVLALYIQSGEVGSLYRQPSWLWLAVPIITYWLVRVWMITLRGAMTDDPIVFAATDPTTWKVMGVLVLVGLVAAYAGVPLPGARP